MCSLFTFKYEMWFRMVVVHWPFTQILGKVKTSSPSLKPSGRLGRYTSEQWLFDDDLDMYIFLVLLCHFSTVFHSWSVFPSCQFAGNVNLPICLTDCWVGTGLSFRVGLIVSNSATNLHFPVDLRWQEGIGAGGWLGWGLTERKVGGNGLSAL